MAHIDDDPTSPDAPSGGWLYAERFELRGMVGVGGMGSVFRAFDRELEEIVALKVIRKELIGRPGIVERFKREVKIARRVTHENVARVYDLGETNGERFLTMEFVEGASLASILDEQGALPLARARDVAMGLCAGLYAAHSAGVIHRDLKPDNVLITPDWRAVITDFGIARSLLLPMGRATARGGMIGTPNYIAPEQLDQGTPADVKSDLYALGALLYEMVTGELMWPKEDPLGVMERTLIDPPDPRALRSQIPAAFADIILRCAARDPVARFESALEVRSALGALGLSPESPPSQPQAPPRVGSRVGTHGEARPETVIAVLPLTDPSGEEDDYLIAGLTQEIIDALSSSPRLSVTPWGLVAPYGQRALRSKAAVAEVGTALGAAIVVEGSLVRGPDKLGVELRIVSESGFSIWSGRFEAPARDVFSLVDAVARGVAKNLASEARATLRKAHAPERVADLYLRARHAYHGFWQDDVERSLSLFQQALAADPDNALLLSGLALARLRSSFFTGAGFDEAREVAARAAKSAPRLPEAHLALASIALHDGDTVGAIRELGVALEGSPTLAEANALLGRIQLEADRIDEAIQRLTWAISLEPEQHLARRDLRRAYVLSGRAGAATLLGSREPPGDEVGIFLGKARLCLWRRDRVGAAAALATAPSPAASTHLSLGFTILELVAHGKRPWESPAFLDFLDKARATPRRALFGAQIEAELLAFEGTGQGVLAALERSARAGLADLSWINRCPLFTELRTDPRFLAVQALVIQRAEPVRQALDSVPRLASRVPAPAPFEARA